MRFAGYRLRRRPGDKKRTLDLKDARLQYLSAFWANGCLAVIEKWVREDFAQPRDFILETLFQPDLFLERSIAAQTK